MSEQSQFVRENVVEIKKFQAEDYSIINNYQVYRYSKYVAKLCPPLRTALTVLEPTTIVFI